MFNPTNISTKKTKLDQSKFTNDDYAVGDLSGKYGYLDEFSNRVLSFNDSHLQLFGYSSIIGRSIVIQEYANDRNFRWACSTIERGYSLKEAREVRAIASFHHPLGYAYGFIRLSQLIGHDGSQSDTTIEVSLRHPGRYNRNSTIDHLWQVYVNPVSVDAIVKQPETR